MTRLGPKIVAGPIKAFHAPPTALLLLRPIAVCTLPAYDPAIAQSGEQLASHFHSTDRWVYVVSGTWWVSSSSHFDPAMAYPLPAGTFAIDRANTVHWDGAKAGGEPAGAGVNGHGPGHEHRARGKRQATAPKEVTVADTKQSWMDASVMGQKTVTSPVDVVAVYQTSYSPKATARHSIASEMKERSDAHGIQTFEAWSRGTGFSRFPWFVDGEGESHWQPSNPASKLFLLGSVFSEREAPPEVTASLHATCSGLDSVDAPVGCSPPDQPTRGMYLLDRYA